MGKPYYLAGEWMSEGEPFEVRSPSTGVVVEITYRPGPEAVRKALDKAAGAFEETKRTPAYRRAELLRAIAAGISERKDSFAECIAEEAGKPVRIARKEVARAVGTFTEAAEECSRMYGEIIPLDVQEASEGRVGLTRLFPIGPVLAITPFNFPLNLVAHKIAPAFAAGCPVILKPSSETPLTALLLAEVIDGESAVEGILSVLPVDGRTAEGLATQQEIKKVTFTGSDEVGWKLKSRAYNKRVTLELGGNAAVILHDDWGDIDGAVDRIVTGGYAYSGQVCISVQRIYIHEDVYDVFIERFVDKVKSLRIGDPLKEETDIGPMITLAEAVRVESWVGEAAAGGARILVGGTRDGSYYSPTVLADAVPGMKVVDEEVFGPVTAVFAYSDFEEALACVNGSRFGLQAGVYTRDIGCARKAFCELEVGGVIIGDVPTFRVDRMPYGGVKGSGFGREGLRCAIREMCEERLLVLSP